MPKHWIVAIAIILGVLAGVVAFAMVTDGSGDSAVSDGITTTSMLEDATTTAITTATDSTSSTSSTSAPSPTSGASTATELPPPSTGAGSDPGPGAPACPPSPGDTDAVALSGDGAVALLIGATVIASECETEVAFGFRDDVAVGGTVAYEPGPFTTSGRGLDVEISGEAFLVVTLEPARTFDFTSATRTYNGADTLFGTGVVSEVRLVGDFEAQLRWIIGLEAAAPFRVVNGPGQITVVLG